MKTSGEESTHVVADSGGLAHVTKVVKDLVKPLFNSGKHFVANLYFNSVSSCEELDLVGLRFVMVFNTALKGFPMAKLNVVI